MVAILLLCFSWLGTPADEAVEPSSARWVPPPIDTQANATGSEALLEALLASHRTSGSEGGQLWFKGRWILGQGWLYLRLMRGAGAESEVVAFEQLLQLHADRTVSGWSFHADGSAHELTGRMREDGLHLKEVDAGGYLHWWLVYRLQEGRLQLELRQRERYDEPVGPARNWAFEPVKGVPTFGARRAAIERVQASPYRPYLGEFRGAERTSAGSTEGRLLCMPALEGHWFRTEYRSLQADGTEVYAGVGYTHCGDDGGMELHWFDQLGDKQWIRGQVGEHGTTAYRYDDAGQTIERHVDQFTERGYRFSMETRLDNQSPWTVAFSADYQRVDS